MAITTVKYFLNHWVTNLRFRENFTDKVNWSLHPKGVAFFLSFHHDCHTDDVSSRGDVESKFSPGWGAIRMGGNCKWYLRSCIA
jgi:hypothetical protein